MTLALFAPKHCYMALVRHSTLCTFFVNVGSRKRGYDFDFPNALISFALLRKKKKKEVDKQTHSVESAALSILLFRLKLAGHMEKVYWS